jgi:hypothetical protein
MPGMTGDKVLKYALKIISRAKDREGFVQVWPIEVRSKAFQ